jgi:hypothetical protein
LWIPLKERIGDETEGDFMDNSNEPHIVENSPIENKQLIT